MMFEFICASGFATRRSKKNNKTYLKNSKTPLQSQHCAGFPDIMYFVSFFNSVSVGYAMLRIPFCR